MAAGIHGSDEITVTIDDGPGGSGQTFTTYVTGEIAAEIISLTEETTTLGDTSKQFAATGMQESPSFTVSGHWDDTATNSPHVVMLAPDNGPQDSTRTVVVVYGNSKTWTLEAILTRYKVSGSVSGLSTYEGEFLPVGVGAWS